MVTSSFVYFPGLPIFHSKDLAHWEQIGHGIHRPDQLDYKNCETSEGLWAPSIRYHNGTFYIINTFVSKGREADRDNYIITAKNPAGPWSDPVFVEGADGIDSSLFFDDDGSVWYVGNFISSECLYEGHHGIYLNELDPVTLQFKGERRIIWDGKKPTAVGLKRPIFTKKTAGITCWLQKAVPLSTTVCRWPAAVPLMGIMKSARETPSYLTDIFPWKSPLPSQDMRTLPIPRTGNGGWFCWLCAPTQADTITSAGKPS